MQLTKKWQNLKKKIKIKKKNEQSIKEVKAERGTTMEDGVKFHNLPLMATN